MATSTEVLSNSDQRFQRLVAGWREERNPYSSDPTQDATPSYLKIIGMGPPAIPLILNEMRRQPDQWFVALNALTDADPVLPEHRGNGREMINDWLDWGRANGYLHAPNSPTDRPARS